MTITISDFILNFREGLPGFRRVETDVAFDEISSSFVSGQIVRSFGRPRGLSKISFFGMQFSFGASSLFVTVSLNLACLARPRFIETFSGTQLESFKTFFFGLNRVREFRICFACRIEVGESF